MFRKLLMAVMISLVPFTAHSNDYSELYEKNVEAVVRVRNGHSTGTGFFVMDRFIITASHVIGFSDKFPVMISGNDFPRIFTEVKTVFKDEETDVAILEVERKDWHRFVSMEEPSTIPLTHKTVKTGQEYWGIGNRMGFLYHAYYGNVSSAHQVFPTSFTDIHYLDGEFFPGDSGGPIMNKDGEVIGIARAFMEGSFRTENPAVDNLENITSSDTVKKGLRDFLDNKQRPFRLNGWDQIEWTFDEVDGSVRVTKIPPEAKRAASYIGLKEGDRNVVVNGTRIRHMSVLGRVLSTISVDDQIKVSVQREGDFFTFVMQKGLDKLASLN